MTTAMLAHKSTMLSNTEGGQLRGVSKPTKSISAHVISVPSAMDRPPRQNKEKHTWS